jgi:hypothetical protein
VRVVKAAVALRPGGPAHRVKVSSLEVLPRACMRAPAWWSGASNVIVPGLDALRVHPASRRGCTLSRHPQEGVVRKRSLPSAQSRARASVSPATISEGTSALMEAFQMGGARGCSAALIWTGSNQSPYQAARMRWSGEVMRSWHSPSGRRWRGQWVRGVKAASPLALLPAR